MREALGNLDRAIMSNDDSDMAEFDLRMIKVGAQPLQVAVKRGPKGRPPFLLFNGIGADLELAEPFLRALKRTEAIIFDVPGVGGSPPPALSLSALVNCASGRAAFDETGTQAR